MHPEQNSGREEVAVAVSQDLAVENQAPLFLESLNQESLNLECLNEDSVLALLKQPDLALAVLEKISKNGGAMKLRKVKLALVAHPKTPRHVSLPLVRHLFTFDLMQLALFPVVPADVKRAAEEALVRRLETISSGERLSLARRASGGVAGELLLDEEARVMQAALENSRLTEAPIIKAVLRQDASAALVQAVCHHPKWSFRREIRVALLRSQHTPMARAVEFARGIPLPAFRELLQSSRLPAEIKAYLLRQTKP
jgi:hypothetical protein